MGALEDFILNSLRITFKISKKIPKRILHDHMDGYCTRVKFGDEISKHVSYAKMTK